MNFYKLEKGAMRAVFFFGFILSLVINTNFLQWGLLIIAPLSILFTYVVFGPLFQKLDFKLKKDKSTQSTDQA